MTWLEKGMWLVVVDRRHATQPELKVAGVYVKRWEATAAAELLAKQFRYNEEIPYGVYVVEVKQGWFAKLVVDPT